MDIKERSNIIGHKNEIDFLTTLYVNKKLPSSLMFLGPSGIGKRLVAINYAKMINCSSDTNKPCNTCQNCIKIENNLSPDFYIIKPEEKKNVIRIDEARNIKKQSSASIYESAYRIFIIDDAQKMNFQTQNALLKTLEEPIGNNLFILISDSLTGIFDTIVSRCYVVKFMPLAISDVSNHLINNCKMNKETSNFLAKYTGGKIGEAIRLVRTDLLARRSEIINVLTKRSRINNFPEVNLSAKGMIRDDIKFMLSWFRDLLLVKTGQREEFIINIDRMAEIENCAKWYTVSDFYKIINDLISYEDYIDYNVNSKIIRDNLMTIVK